MNDRWEEPVMHLGALEKLVGLARDSGVRLRQSYAQVAKRAAIMVL
jgi:hypothetical protein